MAPKFLGSYLKIRSKTTHLAQFHHHFNKRKQTDKQTNKQTNKQKNAKNKSGSLRVCKHFIQLWNEISIGLVWRKEYKAVKVHKTEVNYKIVVEHIWKCKFHLKYWTIVERGLPMPPSYLSSSGSTKPVRQGLPSFFSRTFPTCFSLCLITISLCLLLFDRIHSLQH